MVWYRDMTRLQKKRFWAVIATGVLGSVVVLLVPVVCGFIF